MKKILLLLIVIIGLASISGGFVLSYNMKENKIEDTPKEENLHTSSGVMLDKIVSEYIIDDTYKITNIQLSTSNDVNEFSADVSNIKNLDLELCTYKVEVYDDELLLTDFTIYIDSLLSGDEGYIYSTFNGDIAEANRIVILKN